MNKYISKLKLSRFKLLLAAELLIMIAILPGCFRKDSLVQSFSGADIAETAIWTGNNAVAYGDLISLSPGVYQVRVHTSLAEGQNMSVTVKSDAAYFKSLKVNDINIFSGNDYVTFEVYVTDKVPMAYVECTFDNAGMDSLTEAEIYRTGMGNRALLIIALLVFIVFDFLVMFRKGILEGKIGREKQIVFWVLTFTVFLAYFPYLTDYISIAADSLYHWSRISFLKTTLVNNPVFPVRIQDTWLCGHGYATSIFYGDLFLYIPAVLQIMGFPMMTSIKMFIFLIILATVWVAYFSIKKCVDNKYAAMSGSVIYTLAPYHLLDFYTRDALGECLAMVFIPLVCCGMYLLYTKDVTSPEYKKYKWYLIWGMSGILESHMISTEMTAIMMTVICILFIKKTFRRQTFVQLAETVGITLLINAWFWVPFLYMMKSDVYLVSVMYDPDIQSKGVLLAGLFQWLPNVGSAQTGMYRCEPFQLGAGANIILIIYLLWLICGGKKYRDRSKNSTFFAVLMLVTIVISSQLLPWNTVIKLPIIGYVMTSFQFPVRWLMESCAFLAFFTAFFVKDIILYSEDTFKPYIFKAAMGLAAVVVIFSAVYHVNDIAFSHGAYFIYNAENIGTTGVGNGEYLLEGADASDYYYHDPVADEGLEWSEYVQTGTDIQMYLNNNTSDTLYIEVPLIGYKGYTCTAENQDNAQTAEELPYISDTRGAHEDLRIAVPAGYSGNIHIAYEGPTLFAVAEAVSYISLAVLALIAIYKAITGKKSGQKGIIQH